MSLFLGMASLSQAFLSFQDSSRMSTRALLHGSVGPCGSDYGPVFLLVCLLSVVELGSLLICPRVSAQHASEKETTQDGFMGLVSI